MASPQLIASFSEDYQDYLWHQSITHLPGRSFCSLRKDIKTTWEKKRCLQRSRKRERGE